MCIRDRYKYGKEIRLYGEEKLLLEGLKKSLDIDRLGKKGLLTGFYEMMKAGLGMLLSGCVYFFIGARAIAGAFGAGMIVQYVGAVTQFTGGFSEMAGGLAELRGETPFIENYLGILDSLSLIHISEPTRLGMISYAVFCLKKKKKKTIITL